MKDEEEEDEEEEDEGDGEGMLFEDNESLQRLLDMGFPENRARRAIAICGGNVQVEEEEEEDGSEGLTRGAEEHGVVAGA